MLYVTLTLAALLALEPTDFAPWQKDIDKFASSIEKFEELDRTEEYDDDAILFVGSSSIRLWKTIAEDMQPYPVIQRGYGGAKFSDLAYYADRIISPHDYRALVIFVANDVSGRETDKTPQETARYFQHVLEVVRQKKPDVPVFLIAVTPTASRWDVWDKTQATNVALREVVEADPHGHFVVTAPHYVTKSGEPRTELFIEDQLHLNPDGYKLWAAIIKSKLAHELGDDVPVSFEPWQADIDRWEPDIADFESQDAASKDPEDAILFVGSSSIRLWESIAEDMQPYNVIRRGYGGARYSDLAYYADRIISPHEFDALVLFVGNDVSGAATDKQPYETAAYLQHIVGVVRKKKPNVPIFVIGITPTPRRFDVWPQINATNLALKAVCESRPHVHFIATTRQYLDDDGHPQEELFRDDRLHQNDAGYALWQSIIRAELDKVLDLATAKSPE